MDFAIEASALTKKFKDLTAVSELNLKIPVGEILADRADKLAKK